MNKSQLSRILHFIADVLAEGQTDPEAAATPEPAAPPKRRGRPAGSTNTPAAEPAPPATETPTQSPVEPAPTKPVKSAKAKTLDELRALIRPIVEQPGRGAEVKAVLNTFKPTDWPADKDYQLSELANRPETHAAFVKDIEALTY